MGNKYFYILFRKASQDLEEIFKYISVDLSNPSAAKKLIEEFLEAFERICSFPYSCPIVSDLNLKESDVRKLIVGNYIAFYKVDGTEIKIFRIRHSTTNYQIKI